MRPPSSEGSPKKLVKQVDYLREARNRRAIENEENGTEDDNALHPMYDWKTLNQNKDMDRNSKALLLKERARVIEEGAK